MVVEIVLMEGNEKKVERGGTIKEVFFFWFFLEEIVLTLTC